jgi:O-antigen ligase
MATLSRPSALAVATLSAYLVAIPLALPLLSPQLTAYDAARVAQLVLLPVIAALSAIRLSISPPKHVLWTGLVLMALAIQSCILADRPWMATRELLNIASLVAVGAALGGVRARYPIEWLPKAAALATTSYALPVLSMAVAGAIQGLSISPDLPLPGFANRRYFNHAQTVALPLATCGVLLFRSSALRVITGLGLLASMVLLWITLGRGSLLGFALASAMLAALWCRGRREVRPLALVFSVGLLLAGLMAAALQGLAGPFSQASGLGNDSVTLELASDHSRFALWQKAWGMFLQAPLLGAGPMHYAFGNNEKAAHPHSMPLQLLAEWGLPATLLVGLLCVWLLIALIRRLRIAKDTDAQLGAALLATWVAVLVDSWFSGLWVMPVSQMWLVALMTLSCAWLLKHAPAAQPTPRAWRCLPVLMSSALLLLALPEMVDLRAHLESVKQAFPGEGARPRFWSEGHFGPPPPPTGSR